MFLQTVADPAMGGPGAPPIDQVRAGHGGSTQTRGKFSVKSLSFGHLFA